MDKRDFETLRSRCQARALDQWRWELAREVAYEGEIPEDAAWWIAASDHYRHLVREDVRPCVS